MTTHEYLLQKYGTVLTFQEAAKEIGVAWQTVRNLCLQNKMFALRAGRRWILTTKALADYLDGKENTDEKLEVIKNKKKLI